uniref:Putative ovule protein n=1 Tax=Solanum chacoense TaxID=4108 RepID=A0A0V0GPE1_SOLCH
MGKKPQILEINTSRGPPQNMDPWCINSPQTRESLSEHGGMTSRPFANMGALSQMRRSVFSHYPQQHHKAQNSPKGPSGFVRNPVHTNQIRVNSTSGLHGTIKTRIRGLLNSEPVKGTMNKHNA